MSLPPASPRPNLAETWLAAERDRRAHSCGYLKLQVCLVGWCLKNKQKNLLIAQPDFGGEQDTCGPDFRGTRPAVLSHRFERVCLLLARVSANLYCRILPQESRHRLTSRYTTFRIMFALKQNSHLQPAQVLPPPGQRQGEQGEDKSREAQRGGALERDAQVASGRGA